MKNCKMVVLVFIFFIILFMQPLPSFAQNFKALIFPSDKPKRIDVSQFVSKFILNETVYCTFMVKGFGRDSSGKVDLSCDIQFLDPKRIVRFEEKKFATSTIDATYTPGILVLDNFFEFTFNESDTIGIYTIKAICEDHISQLKANTDFPLMLFDTKESREVITKPIQSTNDIDNLWSEYYRSKNSRAVEMIIRSLGFQDKANLDFATIREAAKLSLIDNAQKYPIVLKSCKCFLRSRSKHITDIIKKFLKEIISDVEKYLLDEDTIGNSKKKDGAVLLLPDSPF